MAAVSPLNHSQLSLALHRLMNEVVEGKEPMRLDEIKRSILNFSDADSAVPVMKGLWRHIQREVVSKTDHKVALVGKEILILCHLLNTFSLKERIVIPERPCEGHNHNASLPPCGALFDFKKEFHRIHSESLSRNPEFRERLFQLISSVQERTVKLDRPRNTIVQLVLASCDTICKLLEEHSVLPVDLITREVNRLDSVLEALYFELHSYEPSAIKRLLQDFLRAPPLIEARGILKRSPDREHSPSRRKVRFAD